jgi:hypothetical protein
MGDPWEILAQSRNYCVALLGVLVYTLDCIVYGIQFCGPPKRLPARFEYVQAAHILVYKTTLFASILGVLQSDSGCNLSSNLIHITEVRISSSPALQPISIHNHNARGRAAGRPIRTG